LEPETLEPETLEPEATFTCAPMSVADLASVVALEIQAFPAPRSATFYRQAVTQNQYANYLVLHAFPLSTGEDEVPPEPTLAAYGGYWLMGEDAYIVSIAVDPRWRRHGLAEWLMLELIAKAWQQGAELVTLEMRAGNRAAGALYHKLGFQEVGRRKRYYRDNDEDALLLSLEGLQEMPTQQIVRARLDTVRVMF